jgi:hypothetical protein
MKQQRTWNGLGRARAILQEWNAEHPDRWTPWEWLEEALLAYREWRTGVRFRPALRRLARWRFEELSRRLPPELVHHATGRR